MYDPHRHHRRSIRLEGWDYSIHAAYFVTICVDGRQSVLGSIVDGDMSLSDFGRITLQTIKWLAENFDRVSIDAWVIMPNHIHLIIVLTHTDDKSESRKPLGRIIGAFKTVSTKQINQLRDAQGNKFWQRNYYEHIIRSERSLIALRHYIDNNPVNWLSDQLHPSAPPNKFNQKPNP